MPICRVNAVALFILTSIAPTVAAPPAGKLGDRSVSAKADTVHRALPRLRRDGYAPRVERRADPAVPRRHLAVFPNRPGAAELQSLRAAGLEPLHYLPENTWLVVERREFRPAALPPSLALLPYRVGDVLSPNLDRARGTDEAVRVAVQFARIDRATQRDLDTVLAMAERVHRGPWQTMQGRYTLVEVELAGSLLDDLAALDTIVNIEPRAPRQLAAEREAMILATYPTATRNDPNFAPGYLAWLAERGFRTDPAAYPPIGVLDTGLWNGTTNDLPPDLMNPAQPSQSRVLFNEWAPTLNAAASRTDDFGHGTLCLSAAIGHSTATGPAHEDAKGFNFGLGIAPFGRAGMMKFGLGVDLGDGGDAAAAWRLYQAGARIGSYSWGIPNGAAYDTLAMEYDSLTRDVQQEVLLPGGSQLYPAVPGNQPFFFVLCAGNSGGDYTPNPATGACATAPLAVQSLWTPGTAKNVFTAGASETASDYTQAEASDFIPQSVPFPANMPGWPCCGPEAIADNAQDLWHPTSRGPTADGRTKPDAVAPASFTLGLGPRCDAPLFFHGNWSAICQWQDECANDIAANPFLRSPHFPPGIGSRYAWSIGTSLSTPALAGYAALASEYLNRKHGISAASPAMLRAYMAHATLRLSGDSTDAQPTTNFDLRNHQGAGLPNFWYAFHPDLSRHVVDQSVVFTAVDGQNYLVDCVVDDPVLPVFAALAWTDAPGFPGGAAWQNDLDLFVFAGGRSYLGNYTWEGPEVLPGLRGISRPVSPLAVVTGDPANNLEHVRILAADLATTPTLRAQVVPRAIVADAIPGNASELDQDFALVLSNVVETPFRGTVFGDLLPGAPVTVPPQKGDSAVLRVVVPGGRANASALRLTADRAARMEHSRDGGRTWHAGPPRFAESRRTQWAHVRIAAKAAVTVRME